jgi:hypothetical protein
MSSTHRASSTTWGDEAGARLCSLILNENTGASQCVAEGRIDLLEFLTLEQLNEPDDCGLTLIYQSIYYDQPEVFKYLVKRGVNPHTFCDPMHFGTPSYYVVTLRRHRMLEVLDSVNVAFTDPCDSLEQVPMVHAKRIDDHQMIEGLDMYIFRGVRAQLLISKNYRRSVDRKRFLRVRSAAKTINRLLRGRWDRKRVEKYKERCRDAYRNAESIERFPWD